MRYRPETALAAESGGLKMHRSPTAGFDHQSLVGDSRSSAKAQKIYSMPIGS
jgi:hypothetical protein